MPFCHLWLPQGITKNNPSIFHDIPIIFHAIPIISLWHSTIIIVVYEFNEKKNRELVPFQPSIFLVSHHKHVSVFPVNPIEPSIKTPCLPCVFHGFSMFFPCFFHVFPCFSMVFHGFPMKIPCFSHENLHKPPQLPGRGPRRRPPPWSRPPLRRAASIWAEREIIYL